MVMLGLFVLNTTVTDGKTDMDSTVFITTPGVNKTYNLPLNLSLTHCTTLLNFSVQLCTFTAVIQSKNGANPFICSKYLPQMLSSCS